MAIEVRPLAEADGEALLALRREALGGEPLAFGSSPGHDRAIAAENVATALDPGAGRIVFGAFAGGELVGMLGLRRESAPRVAHKATLWGMYVRPAARRSGAARALMLAGIAAARAWGVGQLQLGVSAAAPGARRLYESLGFLAWGEEPDAIRSGGRSVATTHFSLALGDARDPAGR